MYLLNWVTTEEEYIVYQIRKLWKGILEGIQMMLLISVDYFFFNLILISKLLLRLEDEKSLTL